MKVGDLSLVRYVTPDGNPSNPDRIQTSGAPRSTEDSAEQRLLYGAILDLLDEPTFPNTMNGQIVDLNTQLMCSNCCDWKLDGEFRQDARNARSRRGRSYWCKKCLSAASLYAPMLVDESKQRKGTRK